jgi:hypothetical protein
MIFKKVKFLRLYIIYFTIQIIFVSGCSNKGGSDTPTNAVKDFVTSVKELNFNKAWNILNEKSKRYYENSSKVRNISGREYFDKSLANPKSLGILSEDFTIVDQKQDGDVAIVIIKSKEGKIFELYTSREEEVWKFDYIKSTQESLKVDDNENNNE